MRPTNHLSKRFIALVILLFISPLLVHFFYPGNSLRGLDRLPGFLQPNGLDLDVVLPPPCKPSVNIVPILLKKGVMIPGTRVDLDATNTRFYSTIPVMGFNPGCDQSVSFFNGDFEWSITQRPSGSIASLVNPETKTPFFTPDRPGEFIIRYTGCPEGCEYVLESGIRLQTGPTSKDIVINVKNEVAIPPETEPSLAPQDAKPSTPFPDLEEKCQFLAGFWNPQWVTVERWDGPGDYRLLEGEVLWSRISRKDDFLNHDSQDFNFGVKPDPAFRDLLAGAPINMNSMEVEWERDHFPEIFRPTRGDRVSVIGYWIHDCAHESHTEIHPPVMVATHRARPIQLPSTTGYGTNVYVPGIVTHLWINEKAGEITRNCSQSGLHQPGGGQGAFMGPHQCLPQTKGFDQNPIDTNFTFNIYLPKNPQKIYAELGLNVPAASLFKRVLNPEGSQGSDPEIIEHLDEGYLEVKVTVSQLSSGKYSRRIETGWVYPSPDNWDLSSWRLEINKIDVHDDGDGIDSGDGDWRFWANVTNTQQEWTKIFDCGGCVHGVEDFNGNPWRTSPSGGVNSLGPDVLLYPDQDLWVHTSGFESDAFVSDFTGHVSELLEQEEKTHAVRSECSDSGLSNCADYTLHFRVIEGARVGNANLTQSGQRIFDSYRIRRVPNPGDIFVPPVAKNWNHPMRVPLSQKDSLDIPFNSRGFFPEQGVEASSISDMSNEEFRKNLSLMEKANPESYKAFIVELREDVDSILVNHKVPEALAEMAELKNALPEPLWDEYFRDIKIPGKTFLLGIPSWILILVGSLVLLILIIFLVRKNA